MSLQQNNHWTLIWQVCMLQTYLHDFNELCEGHEQFLQLPAITLQLPYHLCHLHFISTTIHFKLQYWPWQISLTFVWHGRSHSLRTNLPPVSAPVHADYFPEPASPPAPSSWLLLWAVNIKGDGCVPFLLETCVTFLFLPSASLAMARLCCMLSTSSCFLTNSVWSCIHVTSCRVSPQRYLQTYSWLCRLSRYQPPFVLSYTVRYTSVQILNSVLKYHKKVFIK